MSVVALRLCGPLQAWGSGSKFVRRTTELAPTKSGVVGLVAAAKGLRRTDPLGELPGLRLAVRIDQPGRLLRDFQTAQQPRKERDGSVTWKSLPLSERYYLGDAAYLAVLEGDQALVEQIDAAVRSPAFPLYLGRRSCPPAGPVALGIYDTDLATALETVPWLASRHHQARHRAGRVQLETIRDARPDEPGAERIHDDPVSFDPNRRMYAWRSVLRDSVVVDNPRGVGDVTPEHDPMPVLGGG
ncbi:type I-E CRISPR-associated protein Cas5/CasD [Actinobacteria bacterium YIM 96077]|uniref:Type I-E CRISPR-associated protein Cas5/CasD n=1 Tax=Phytoactinopolyspora halophila TaxID=1981511 RepID=A0A329QN02_9ACTN|nr:type I-E CRISPR-associated protein Cas5/CasD [Phytoactinopolyspora halophila]AYY12434.1 type I-E CRISPR-associated protein Cas5/CasD [Actinobacteria bacterium YIM 96077]RAW11988.1 type I-E CRISPR-associated protein Cas5/CasD [Phytoactinopolyspora halophila]